MTPLELLPTELHDAILEHIDNDATVRRQTYLALCRTSKAMKEAATPFLYRSISTVKSPQALRLILENIAHRPWLLQHIKHLQLKTLCGTPFPKIFGALSPELSTIERILVSILHKGHLSVGQQMHIHWGDWSKQVILTCLLATHAKTISIQTTSGDQWYSSFVWLSDLISGQVVGSPTRFHHSAFRCLQALSLKSDAKNSLSWNMVRWFSALPTLRFCQIICMNGIGSVWQPFAELSLQEDPTVRRSNLELLYIVSLRGDIDFDGMKRTITELNMLQSFTIILQHSEVNTVGIKQVVQCLSAHSRHLKAVTSIVPGAVQAQGPNMQPMVMFDHLENLTLDSSNLWNLWQQGPLVRSIQKRVLPQFLPPNLKALTIYFLMKAFRNWPQIIVCVLMDAPSSLRSFRLSFADNEVNFNQANLKVAADSLKNGYFSISAHDSSQCGIHIDIKNPAELSKALFHRTRLPISFLTLRLKPLACDPEVRLLIEETGLAGEFNRLSDAIKQLHSGDRQ